MITNYELRFIVDFKKVEVVMYCNQRKKRPYINKHMV
jgi:hypothetical protein